MEENLKRLATKDPLFKLNCKHVVKSLQFFCCPFLLCLLSLFFFHFSKAQTFTDVVLQKLGNSPRTKQIRLFYELNKERFFWVVRVPLLEDLLEVIAQADSLALNARDYQFEFMQQFRAHPNLRTKSDSMEAEACFADAALHFFSDLYFGNQEPTFQYRSYAFTRDESKLVQLVFNSARTDSLVHLVKLFRPSAKTYSIFMEKRNWFRKMLAEKDFRDIPVSVTKTEQNNRALLARLYQLGVLDSQVTFMDEKRLKPSLRKAQLLFDVFVDGTLRSTTVKAFNVPLQQRMSELTRAINYIRWLEQAKANFVLVLNIPSTDFWVYRLNDSLLYSKVIVGKKSTPTPTLTSIITEVILYPYWMVPHKIAVRELLPAIQQNPYFLQWGNYQVLNKAGKVLNPDHINWKSLSRAYFPYIIRQSTGCDNALGIVKFQFDNPFTVYLHDTPGKGLFFLNKRYFSHGCMRVESPVELAHIVLDRNRLAIDTLTEKGCLYHQSPVVVPVQKQLPIIILYSTAWYTKTGELRFYDDVYGKYN